MRSRRSSRRDSPILPTFEEHPLRPHHQSSNNATQVAADVLQWRQREAAQREADTRIQQVGGLTAEINTLKYSLKTSKRL